MHLVPVSPPHDSNPTNRIAPHRFVNCFIYYSIQMRSTEQDTHIYLNHAYMGVIEVPANLVAWALMSCTLTGRRFGASVSYALCSVMAVLSLLTINAGKCNTSAHLYTYTYTYSHMPMYVYTHLHIHACT